MSYKISCPHCNKTLNAPEDALGKVLPCPVCKQLMRIPHQPEPLPPLRPVAAKVVPPPVVQAQAKSTSPMPHGMPPVPEISHESDAPINAADLLAGYRITSKPRSVGIKEGITRALGAAKKRGRAMKLGHEAKSLQTAIEAQLEALGTLTLAHRPGTVDIGQQVADLSQVQDEVSQKESMLNALRQTKGSAPVAKELSKEVAQLHIRQKAAMIAIGRKALGV